MYTSDFFASTETTKNLSSRRRSPYVRRRKIELKREKSSIPRLHSFFRLASAIYSEFRSTNVAGCCERKNGCTGSAIGDEAVRDNLNDISMSASSRPLSGVGKGVMNSGYREIPRGGKKIPAAASRVYQTGEFIAQRVRVRRGFAQ